MRPRTPRGFRDVLFAEAREREIVSNAINAAFASWGYAPVDTPVVEEDSTLVRGAGGELERAAFRFFDVDGSLLALRPEMTVPIARMAAARLAERPGPHRIRYAAPVFREYASLRGQARQFTQVGVELIGAPGPAADAEVVMLLLDALQASGLSSYVVGIGTGEVLRAIIEKADASAEWQDAIIAAAQGRNLVEIDALAETVGLAPELSAALREVPRLGGGAEVLDRCQELAKACGIEQSLETFAATWRLLESLGKADRIRIDFGIMRSFAYYTGIQIEAYAPGFGLPLAGGGRYDRLLASFGAPAPSAGFALGLERVMIALAEEGGTPRLEPLDAVVGGQDAAGVLAAAMRLRGAGWQVCVSPGKTGITLVRHAEGVGAAEAILVEADGRLVRVDRAGGPAEPLGDPLPCAPRHSWAAGKKEVR